MDAPLLMYLDDRVKLGDHDFVVAEKHKLMPSVYAGIEIKEDTKRKLEAVIHSGPTCVAICSGKHSSPNSVTHATDVHKNNQSSAGENLMVPKIDLGPKNFIIFAYILLSLCFNYYRDVELSTFSQLKGPFMM